MGRASDAAGAISEGTNHLCALLAWMDSGTVTDLPMDLTILENAMSAMEGALRDVVFSGDWFCGGAQLTAQDVARVVRLKELITEWKSTGARPPELATLADAALCALWGLPSWRELVKAAGR